MPLANAHETIKQIASVLFSAEERRLEKVIDGLISSNKELHPDKPHDGFTYQGKPYFPANLPRGSRARVSLHFSLQDDMEAYLKDLEQVWTDRYLISQMLFLVLQPCECLQDMRDALPNCIVDTLENFRRLPRTREDAFTIRDNARTYRQYLKVLPRIEFYAVARLVY